MSLLRDVPNVLNLKPSWMELQLVPVILIPLSAIEGYMLGGTDPSEGPDPSHMGNGKFREVQGNSVEKKPPNPFKVQGPWLLFSLTAGDSFW